MCLLISRVVYYVVLRLLAGAHALAGLALRHDLVADPGQADQAPNVTNGQIILAGNGHKVTGAVAVVQLK